MIPRCLITLEIFLLLYLPAALISIPLVALLLLTPWDGRSTIFGNSKWGKGEKNPAWGRSGYWAAFLWLVYRNPVNNLAELVLCAPYKSSYMLAGNPDIGDKTEGGSYRIKMGSYWEFYWIKPYNNKTRCLRARLGWKIHRNADNTCGFVFSINPFKAYSGA